MARNIKSFSEFKKELETSPVLQQEFQTDPIRAVQQFEQKSPLDTDSWIYRIVVLGMSLTILTIIIGVIVLISMEKIADDKDVPTIFTAIGSAAIGALAGLLAPAPRQIEK